jgi:Na+-translocating ferredoxin:NAD+ oxidoreductase RnfE subunit
LLNNKIWATKVLKERNLIMKKIVKWERSKILIPIIIIVVVAFENDFIIEYLVDQYSLFGYIIALAIVIGFIVITQLIIATSYEWIEKYKIVKNEIESHREQEIL